MNIKKLPHHVKKYVKNKPFDIFWSDAAEVEFHKRSTPLIAEMELKFACMVTMRVNFHDNVAEATSLNITDKLRVIYRPVIGQSCSISEVQSGGITRELKTGCMAERFPKYLRIDFIKNTWIGKYS